jgi:hypothetical protein
MLTRRDSPSTDDSTVNDSWEATCSGERVSPLELHEDAMHSTAQLRMAFKRGPLEEAEISVAAVRSRKSLIIGAVTSSLFHAERVWLEMRA